MSIQPGDTIPEVTLKHIDDGVHTIDTPTLFSDKKVVLFGAGNKNVTVRYKNR